MALIGDVNPTSPRPAKSSGTTLSQAAAYLVFVVASGFTLAVIFGLLP